MLLGYWLESGLLGVLAALVSLRVIGFGAGWVFLVLGLVMRTPNAVMMLGFSSIVSLLFASNITVDLGTMLAWLRVFVDINPVSLTTTAGLMNGGATWTEQGLALLTAALLAITLALVTRWVYLRG